MSAMGREFLIRLATPADAEAIALESRAEIEHGLEWGWEPWRVSEAMAHPETNVVVAIDGVRMLGFGIMEYRSDVAHLVLFAVRRDARRRGIGSALLLWLEKVAAVAGITQFRVEARLANVGAREFYRRHGYVEIEVVAGMYQGSEDGVRLGKAAGARSFIDIRHAAPREAAELTGIAREAKAMWGYARQALAAWEEQLTIAESEVALRPVFVALMDGRIAGFYSLAPGSEDWELDNLWVRPSHVRRGIGAAMLSHALERAREGGARGVCIDSDPNAEPFYLRAGAVRVGEIPAPIDGEPARVRPQLRLGLPRVT
jgi:ribosomal-protein-alanine N-acetyltransferase